MIAGNYITLFYYISKHKAIKIALYMLLVVMLALVVEAVIWAIAKIENTELKHEVKLDIERNYKQEQLNRLNLHLKTAIPLVDSLETKYKTGLSQSDVMKQIGDLAQQHHLRVLSQSFTRSEGDDTNSSASTIELRITGHYADLRRMMNKIPALPVWLEIAEVHLEQLKNKQDIGAQIRLVVLKEHNE